MKAERVKIRAKKVYFTIKYFLDYFSLLRYESPIDMKNNSFIGAKIVVAPHADDELIGCYKGALEDFHNTSIFYLGMGNNSRTIDLIRKSEIVKLCKDMKLDYYEYNGIERDNIAAKIEDIGPSYIFVPYYIDWHPDHRIVTKNMVNIIRYIGKQINIAFYAVTIPISKYDVNYAIPMDYKAQFNKWKIMKNVYRSQRHLPIFRFIINEWINGRLINVRAAEFYKVIDGTEIDELNKVANYINYYDPAVLETYIDNLYIMRRFVDRIWLNAKHTDPLRN